MYMLQIAHRGYSRIYGDNNIESFTQAIMHKFDMLEFDVQLSREGTIVIYHDIDIDGEYVSSLTEKELKRKGVISLNEMLLTIDINEIKLFFDLKGQDDVISVLLPLLKTKYTNDELKRIYISGFNRHFVDIIKKSGLPLKLGFTSENNFTFDIYDMIIKNLDFICIHYNALNNETIDYFHKNNILIFTYTCKNDFIFKHMIKYKVDGIVTNYPLS
jgi:glycerophosphoryl diester phosphodiesterase